MCEKNPWREVRWCLRKRRSMKLTETAWEIFSEYELIRRTDSRSIHSIGALWDDLTHTNNASSSCLCSLRDLRPFMSFNPFKHTHMMWSQTSECSVDCRPFRVQTHTQQGYRIHPQVTHQWFELETVWERHEENLLDRTHVTLTEMFVWPYSVFRSQYLSIYFKYLLWNGFNYFQLDEPSFQWTCQCKVTETNQG